MPFAAVTCCGFDEPVTPERCVEHACSRTNRCPYTAELLAALFATVQNRGERLSTTALLSKCLRQEHLCRVEDYTLAPSDLYAAFKGTMFHGQLERHAQPGTVEEARYHVELPDLGTVTGSPDLVDVVHGVLYDYKFTANAPRFGKPWDNHVQQLNINRWLVDFAHQVEYGKESIECEIGEYRGEYVGLGIEGNPSYMYDLTEEEAVRKFFVPVDWQDLIIVYMDEKGPQSMPALKSVQVPKKSGDGTKAMRVPDIWTDAAAEAFIVERYEAAFDALVKRELPRIPPGFEGQAHPLCNYCPKKARCRELEVVELLTERDAA